MLKGFMGKDRHESISFLKREWGIRTAIGFLLFFIFSASSPALSSEVVLLESGERTFLLGKHVDYLEDREKTWSIDDVSSMPVSGKFEKSQWEVPNFGLSDSAFWLRMTVMQPEEEKGKKEWVLEVGNPVMDLVRLYIAKPEGGFIEKESGIDLPFGGRDIQHRNMCFRVETSPGQPLTMYLRIQSGTSIHIPLSLINPITFAEKVNRIQFGLGIYYGIVLVMIFYNLFIFIAVRDRNYLYYVCYLVSYLLFQASMNGYGVEYLWQNFPWWAKMCVSFSATATSLTLAIFTRGFLNTPVTVPFHDKVIRFFIGLSILMTPISLIIPHGIGVKIGALIGFIVCLWALAAGVVCYRKKFRAALYFLLAWSIFLIGVLIFVLKAFGVIPATMLTQYAVQIGSALQVILLSLGLADKINEERRGKSEAREKEIAARREALMIRERAMEDLKREDVSRRKFLEKITESLKAISARIEGNSESAGKADGLMGKVRGVVHSAETTLQELLVSMDEIAKAGEETSKIIDSIDEIASQTNLLSLNAAVEAARAGQAGAGFAVVAEEVRNLALRSAKSAKETSLMVEGVIMKIQNGTRTAEQTGSAFSRVNEISDEAGKLVSDISASSEDQSREIERINRAIEELEGLKMDSGIVKYGL